MDPIIPKDMIRAKARAAFDRGVGRDDHGFNWHSSCAIDTWQEEWDRCIQAWHASTQGQQLEVSPP